MKNPFPFLMFLAVSTLAGCCVHSGLRHPGDRPTLVDELKSDTIALVHRAADDDVLPFCSAVWIDKDRAITADHCARAPVEALVKTLMPGDDVDEDDEDAVKKFLAAREEMVQKLEDGTKIDYITDKESTGVYRKPKASHKFKVLKHDKDHDLALLVVDDPKDIPDHHVAPLVDKAPPVGEEVHVMGHPTGMTWTYVRAMIGAYREENFRPTEGRHKKGPFVQVIGAVYKGNSGGGAFTANGELVGIASFLVPSPNHCMFVHVETIRSFLGRPVPR